MKKEYIFPILLIFIFPLISSLNLTIDKVSSGEVMIAGLNRPASLDFKITNNEASTSLEFYNLVGFRIFPAGKIPIDAFETKEITLEIYPIGDFTYEGFYTFQYFIKADDGSEIERTLTFKRIKLEDAIEIGASSFDPESSSIDVFVRNNENFNFGDMTAKLSSPFFNVEKTFSLEPNEKEIITISLNKEDFKQLVAGFYTMKAEINADEAKAVLETGLQFSEKDIVTTTQRDFGLVVNTKTIKKINEGNAITPTETIVKKNIISRLFTTFNPEPDSVNRNGFSITYTWSRVLKPAESFEVAVKTNWLFPVLIVLLVVVIVALAKQYTKTNLEIRKRVSFVRAKGGEFALKVHITAIANKHVEKVNVIDRLPLMVKIYERFGTETPSKVDEKNRRIEWYFDKLEQGEVRSISYIIYSKVGVFGKFELPSAKAIYEREGKLHESDSNKAFFVAEQRTKDLPEE